MRDWNTAKSVQPRINEDNKLYMLQCVFRLPDLFSIARDELKPEHFSQLTEPHYSILWRSALVVASSNESCLPEDENLARTLIELEATKLSDNAPSNLTAGGLLDRLFNSETEDGIISLIYESRDKQALDFKTGMALLKQFLEERAVFDPFRKLADQLGTNTVPANIDTILDKVRADRERISSLDSNPVEELVPDSWESNAIYQVPSNISFFDAAMDGGPAKGEVIVLLGPTGGGKEQPLDSLIQTPTGPIRMGDVELGQKICAVDGTTTTVTGVFPQGRKPVYKLTFTTGDSVEAGRDHLWQVSSMTGNWSGTRIVTTEYLLNNLKTANGRCKFAIEVPKPIEMEEVYVPIDPYLMGLLLGDGSFRHGISFTNADRELLDKIKVLSKGLAGTRETKSNKSDITYTVFFKQTNNNENILLEAIEELGLFNKLSKDKEIPECYMYNSISNRLSLLQGLMDTDGYAGEGRHVNFYSSSEKLALQVKWLVESLGGICRIRIKHIKAYPENEYYDCVIMMDDARCLFRLARKACRVIPRTKYKIKRAIKSIEYVGDEETQCISVNHPSHLYLTDHCVVTHNTMSGIMVAVNGARYQMQQHRLGLDSGYWYYFSYESPITPDIRARAMGYAAEIHFNTMKTFTHTSQLSTTGNLKDYEIKRWDKQLKAGLPVPGEYERYKATVEALGDKLKLIDMSGTKKPAVGTKGIEEIARVLQEGKSNGHTPVGIVIDYAGIMVERYMAAKNEKIENEFFYLNRFVNNIRTQVAGRFSCICWVLHQLHGEAAAASATTKQHHSKARGARNFADNANFAFNIGTKDTQTGCCVITCSKARRAEAIKNPPIVFIDGAFGRMEAQDNRYQLDQNTKKIVDKELAKRFQGNVVDLSATINRTRPSRNPNLVTDL